MKTFQTFLRESIPTVTLYHGGRNLERNHLETIAHKKGNWEYGPGLYLTTHYDTAYKYAKGGGKVFKVTVEEGREADDVRLTREVIEKFAKQHVIGRKRQIVADAVNRNINRLKSDDISGRNHFLMSFLKRKKRTVGGIPDAFRVLMHELQSLCFHVHYTEDYRLTYPTLLESSHIPETPLPGNYGRGS